MKYLTLIFLLSILFFGCKETEEVTGWDYNDPRNGGFQKLPFIEQETAPGIKLIEGGSVVLTKNGKPDTLTVHSFYMAEHEETNEQYLSYLTFLKTYFSKATYEAALPDTTVWSYEKLSEEEQNYRINHYLRNPKYKNHPVVGVSPQQIEKYALWKTDRINELILIREGVIYFEEFDDSSQVFNTDFYFNKATVYNYQKIEKDSINEIRFDKNRRFYRAIIKEDGIFGPNHRLPKTQNGNGQVYASEIVYLISSKPLTPLIILKK